MTVNLSFLIWSTYFLWRSTIIYLLSEGCAIAEGHSYYFPSYCLLSWFRSVSLDSCSLDATELVLRHTWDNKNLHIKCWICWIYCLGPKWKMMEHYDKSLNCVFEFNVWLIKKCESQCWNQAVIISACFNMTPIDQKSRQSYIVCSMG